MTFSLKVKMRPAGETDTMRAAGTIPAVVYGGDRAKPVSVAATYGEFDKLYNEAGESSLIDCHIEGESEPVKVLIQEVQYDPVKGRVIHVDFRQIKMSEAMTATVELNFIGEAPAVKGLGGTLMKPHNQVTVKCLPKDLVSEITVDLSVLTGFDVAIRVGDLQLPPGITVADDVEMLLAKVSPPLTEDQLKAMEETAAPVVDLSAIEVEKKGKKEEEGEAAVEEKK